MTMPTFAESFRTALQKAMAPLARILLSAGIGYKEFDAIAKQAFVDVAAEGFGVRGRQTNTSRIAAMTGLTRKEVTKIRRQTGVASTVGDHSIPAADVLHCWHTNDDFLNERGEPRALPLVGPSPTFPELVERVVRDIPTGAMRRELERVNALLVVDGCLLPSRRYIRPEKEDLFVRCVRRPLYHLLQTIVHNLDPGLGDDSDKRGFSERIVYSNHIPVNRLAAVRTEARSRLEGFSESIDDWFAVVEETDSKEEKTVGVGLFYFEDDLEI
jgi:hypothetical protein